MNEIKTITSYNLWANQRISNWLLSNEFKKLSQPCDSSFQTIAKTIKHILEAQVLYLSIIQQTPITKNKNDGNFVINDIEKLIEQSKDFSYYSSQLQTKQLNETRKIDFKFLSGNFSQGELILHCMNHSTFHRGQIITIGHQLKLTKAPSTDFLFFLSKLESDKRQQKRQKLE